VSQMEEDRIIDQWDNDIEHFTQYADGTILVETNGVRKCGWCGFELGNSSLGDLCESCNKLPKKICVDGPFTDIKVYVSDNQQPDIIETKFMISDSDG
jgi:hypothetical protein